MDAMRDLVGKEVRVTGTIAESSELRRAMPENRSAGDRREGLDIDAGDLAKVEVQGIVRSPTCAATRGNARVGRPLRPAGANKKGWSEIAPALSIPNS